MQIYGFQYFRRWLSTVTANLIRRLHSLTADSHHLLLLYLSTEIEIASASAAEPYLILEYEKFVDLQKISNIKEFHLFMYPSILG